MATKVLIIRFSSIGDIVLTTPVIRCLKQQLSGEVEVHYLTKKKFAGVVAGNPHLHTVHTIEDRVSEVMPELKAMGFHYVIDLHRNIRSGFVKRGLGVLSFTFNKINTPKWLKVKLKVDVLPSVHIVDRYLKTVEAFGIENDGLGLEYFIDPADEVPPESWPETHQNGYIAFVIGGSFATKMLPVEKVISICRKLTAPIVLLGGPDDKERGEAIAEELGSRVWNACGKYKLDQSASLVRQADKVIAHDTGLMHIAAAYKKDIISIWGNTIPQFGMAPYLPEGQGSSTIVQVNGLKCRPCSKLGYKECPKKHFRCMKEIDEEKVVQACQPS